MKTAAVVLAGGSGKRMRSDVPKQYMELCGHPLLYYSLKCFEDSFADSIVLVTAAGEEEYCRRNIVERYGFGKVKSVVCGGRERYHSVMHGIEAADPAADYIFIHDGARPFLRGEVLQRALEDVQKNRACVVAVRTKDTVKLADEEDFVAGTPKRTSVWQMQTPQVFEAGLIREAYGRLAQQEKELLERGVEITDDAMIVELLTEQKVHLLQGDYDNIKITTPEDMEYGAWLLERRAHG